jgi:hypothetical protein
MNCSGLVPFLRFARDMQGRDFMPTQAELAVVYRVTRRTICRWIDVMEEAEWTMPPRNRPGPRSDA